MVDLAGVSVPLSLLVPGLMALLVAILLWTVEVPVTQSTLLALSPWAVVGAGAHALFSIDAYDQWAEVFFGPLSVYLTTFTVAGMVWAMMSIASDLSGDSVRDAQYLAAAGTGAALTVGAAVLEGAQGASLSTIYPTFGGLLATVVIASVGYVVVNFVYPRALVQTGLLGFLVVFAHAFDGVMTAVGADLFDQGAGYTAGERVLSFAAGLPTADAIGTGWVLVLAKLLLAVLLVSLFGYLLSRDRFEDRPAPVYLALAAVAAWGLGPALHHFFTLLVAG